MPSLKIAIAGGSLGGLFAAVLLHDAGHDVTVYERSRHGLEGRGAGLVGQRDIFAILRAVGCEHVARVGVVARERIFLDRSGAIVNRQQTPQTQISWDMLFRAFRERVPDERYVSGRTIISAEQSEGAARLIFADGGTVEADLVIGADGVGSAVRKAVAGPEAAPAYAGYAAWRGLYSEKDLPAEAAAELLDRFAFFSMARSHILGYLVAGPDGSSEVGRRRYNWVWYRRVAEADGSLARALTDASGQVHQFSLPAGAMPQAARDDLVRAAEEVLPPQFAAAVAAETSPFIQAIEAPPNSRTAPAPRVSQGRATTFGDLGAVTSWLAAAAAKVGTAARPWSAVRISSTEDGRLASSILSIHDFCCCADAALPTVF